MMLIINMNRKRIKPLSKRAEIVLQVLGGMIKAGRIERNMSQANLAERVGVSRYTISLLEKGNPNVGIGTVLESAIIVGIPIMEDDVRQMTKVSQAIANLIEILPSKRVGKKVELDNDF
ncbi:helix-turn-helix transcriptional regulator [Candidatus Marithrix sp. Canyon 246]|uniref:helix-turn-helix transcriptional regulator n=2 Tax=Candidatus Marithrix sp. Canyon 246 TaxID=1827136 RepID=UPI0009F26133|nr:helix-turn-helix domain-containing protein [Candidatus Marithrix sp. Canyon 246]